MKLSILLLFAAFNLCSCAETEKVQSPDEVLELAFNELNNWETIGFTTESSVGTNSKTSTTYKLKKVGYEPYLKLFFFKEMDSEITVYYKLASLSVVEDKKKKITNFDFNSGPSIPKYLDAYMADDDNLWGFIKKMNQFKADIVYVEESVVNNQRAFVYKFQDYKLWLSAKSAKPLKLEITKEKSGKKDIVFDAVVYNEPMDDGVFTPKEKPGYVSSTFGASKEPLLNIDAPNWTMLDLNGNQVTLNSFKGRPIFLETWLSSCSHCMASLPKVKQIENEFGDKIKVITVNFDYDLEETKETVKAKDITYLVLQGNATFDKAYELRSFPSYFVINSDGIIMYSGRGAIEGNKEAALLEAIRNVK